MDTENGKTKCYFQQREEKEYSQKGQEVHLFKDNVQSGFLQAFLSKFIRQNKVPTFTCICNQVTSL